MNESLLTPSIKSTLSVAQQKGMGGPILLFLCGHQPLAFITGQFLHLCTPLGAQLGFGSMCEWAELLSHPTGPDLIEAELNS